MTGLASDKWKKEAVYNYWGCTLDSFKCKRPSTVNQPHQPFHSGRWGFLFEPAPLLIFALYDQIIINSVFTIEHKAQALSPAYHRATIVFCLL